MLRYLLILLVLCFRPAAAQRADSLWEPLPLKFNWQVGKLYPDPVTGDLYITRFMGTVNGLESCLVKWDGKYATLMQTPFQACFDIVRHKGDLIVNAQNFDPLLVHHIMSFDGYAWRNLDSFDKDASPWLLHTLDSSLVVTGFFDSIGGLPIRQAALWDKRSGWRDLHRLDTCFRDHAFINGLERYKGNIYIGGLMFAPRSTRNIARFDGVRWTDVGGGMRGNGLSVVNCMLVWNDELYVAGQFLERDGAPGNCIAKWDGQRWHRLGGGITQFGYEASIYDMTVYRNNLYVVGVFGEAGGVPANNIAKWDGRRWCSLNTNLHGGTPLQIKVAKGELYMSGGLDTINGKQVSHIARWMGGDYVDKCGPAQGVSIGEVPLAGEVAALYPNPVSGVLRIANPNVRDLRIYDAAGKLIWTGSNADMSAGIDVSGWPEGFYFARGVLQSGTSFSSKFTKL